MHISETKTVHFLNLDIDQVFSKISGMCVRDISFWKSADNFHIYAFSKVHFITNTGIRHCEY
jgi:hypothetical protein